MTQFRQIGDDLFIGPQPTEAEIEAAKKLGIKTVVDFRVPTETATSNEALVKRSGLDYVNIPVNKANLMHDQIDELGKALSSKEGPFLLHCATGTRAAMLLALRRARQHGWSAERTFEEARSLGFALEKSAEFSDLVRKTTSRH
jgi:uncharacterized protein (TIGR01244 family)